MKKGKIILEVLLVLVLVAVAVLGVMWHQGMFDKPELPDNRWAIRNLKLDVGEEEIAFSPEIRLSVVEESDKKGEVTRNAAHFEVGMGDQILMPITGEYANGSLNMTIGSSGRVYSLTAATVEELLAEAMDGTAASGLDPALLDSVKNMFTSLGEMMALQNDKDFTKQQAALSAAMFEKMLGAAGEETQVEIDGKKYKGTRYAGKLSAGGSFASLDALRESEQPVIAKYAQSMLDLFNAAIGSDYASFADFFASETAEAELEAADMGEMDVVYVYDKKLTYVKSTMTQNVNGSEVVMNIEETLRDGEMTAAADAQMPDGSMTMNMNYDRDGFHADMDLNQSSVTDMSMFSMTSDTAMKLTADGAKTEGLWNAAVDMNIDSSSSYDFGSGPMSENVTIGLKGSYAEAREDDQSITGALAASVELGGADYGLSFELNRGKDTVIPALTAEGSEVYEITQDAGDELLGLLQADAMQLVTDASQLMTDPGVMQVVEFFAPAAAYEEEDVALEDGDLYADESYDTGDASFEEEFETVMSFAEAAEIYAGAMPVYTPPMGYELLGINVNDYSMVIGYDNGSSIFQISVTDLGLDTGAAAIAMDPAQFEYFEMDELVYDAYIITENAIVEFAFEGVSRADAEAIIRGLRI